MTSKHNTQVMYNEDMTLAITVVSPEGVVVAADSRLTVTMKQGDAIIPNYYDNAMKVLDFIKPHAFVAATTYGAGTIGGRTATSYSKEFQATLGATRLTIKTYAKKLLKFYKEQWEKVTHEENESKLFFQVSGINKNSIYPEAYLVTIPDDDEPQLLIKEGAFSFAWGGQTDVVFRLAKGYDPTILNEINGIGLDINVGEKIQNIMNSKELSIPVHLYSLQDCIDLARFLIKTTCEAQNLALGIRGVGGSIDIGYITRDDDFTFISRKELN